MFNHKCYDFELDMTRLKRNIFYSYFVSLVDKKGLHFFNKKICTILCMK